MKWKTNVTAAAAQRITGRRFMRSALVAAMAVIALSAVSAASAQAPPEMPRPRDSCTASLTLAPSVIPFSSGQPVELQVSGLEPHAEYRIFAGSRPLGGGFAAGDGTAFNSIVLDTFAAAIVPVQVATSGRCAEATLTVAGPLRARCVRVDINDEFIICPLLSR